MRGLPLTQRMLLAWKAMTQLFDAQSAQAARGLLGGIFPASTGPVPHRGTFELLNTVNESPWIRACAGKIADCMVDVTWTLSYAKDPRTGIPKRHMGYVQKAAGPDRRRLLKGPQQEDALVEVTDHPLLTALRTGNSLLTGGELRWLISIYFDMVGDVFLVKQRNALGTPIAFWPIPPHWIAETPTPKRRTYRAAWLAWQTELPDSEVLWLKNPNPVNPYDRGSGLARSLDDELATDEYAAKHTLKFFKNSARPDMLIMPAKDAAPFGELERDRFEQWWNEKLQGFWRSFRPLFLRTPVEVKLLEQNFRNLQLAELRKHERDTILQVWGVPPEMFGIVAASNRSTIDMAPTIFARYVLTPRLERWREFLQERLVPEYDERLILDYLSPVPADRKFKLEVMKAQPSAYQLNEFRQLAEDNPDETLDGIYAQATAPIGSGAPSDGEDGSAPDRDAVELQNLDDEEAAELHALLTKSLRR